MKPQYLLLAIVLISCEKQSITPKEQFLVIDDNNQYVITQYDTILRGGYYDPQFLNIDLDDDNIMDFKFLVNIWGSPGMGDFYEVTFYCLHPDAFLNITEFTDTLYSYIEYDTIRNGVNTTINIYQIRDCHKNEPNASIFSIEKKINASFFNSGDTIQGNSYRCDTIKLANDSYINPWDPETRGDTTIYSYHYIYDDCYSFPQQATKYIIVKTILGEKKYFGWIKLNVLNSYSIVIFETAVLELDN